MRNTITLHEIKVSEIIEGCNVGQTFYKDDPFRGEFIVVVYDGVEKNVVTVDKDTGQVTRLDKARFMLDGYTKFLLSPDDTLYFYPSVPFEVDKIFPSPVYKGVTITIHPPTNIKPLNPLNPLNPLKGD